MNRIRGAVSGETSARQRGRAFLAVPLVLVNLTAVWGQAGWAYDHITAVTVEAIKEQQAQIDGLKKANADLRDQVEKLIQKIEKKSAK